MKEDSNQYAKHSAPSLTERAEGKSESAPSLKRRTAQGLIWGGFSNGMVQLLGAVFGLILLNKLAPADYGKMAALFVFSNVAGCLQESGFTAALANKKEARHEDYNAVFWFNVIAGSIIYVILFLSAPLIADLYQEPALESLSRFVFIGLWISCLGISQQAWLFSNLKVKEVSLINLTALIGSNIVGILLVFRGWAYWGLAVQNVLYTAIGTSLRWVVSPWRPSFHINLRPAWQMFGFSSKLLVNSLAYQLNNNAFGALLNLFYPGGHVAGIYSTARKWDDMAISTIGGMVQGVAQPVLRESQSEVPSHFPREEANKSSGRQADTIAPPQVEREMASPRRGREGAVFRKLLRFTCFVSFPCLLGLALIAEDFIVLLVGEKWHESALLLSMLCVYGAFSPVVTLYSNLVISRGRSTINMVIGLLNCAFVWGGIIVLHALGYGLHEMVIFYVALNIGWLFVWQACARRLIGLRWRHALKDISPFFVFALAVMAVAYFATQSLPISWLRMCLRIIIAVVLYVGSLWIARAQILRESIAYIFKKEKVKG